MDDNNGGTDTQDVVITITGTNDAPIIDSAAQSGSITETADLAPAADAAPANATGTITFDDVDLSDVPTASITASSVTGGTAVAECGSGGGVAGQSVLERGHRQRRWFGLGGLDLQRWRTARSTSWVPARPSS